MKVAVVGGTGFVGRYLVDALRRAGHDVSLLVRHGSESKVENPPDVHIVQGDAGDADALRALMSGRDAFVYNVGILRESRRLGITYERTQYEGVVNCVDAAISEGVQRCLLMSANGVKIPGTPYQETKRRAEEVVFGSGLDATVFRPSVIFGDPRGRMEFASQLLRDMVRPPIPAVGFFSGLSPAQGQVMMSPVHVSDVADAFESALENPDTYGEIFELGGPEALSWSEMIRRIAVATGREKWIIPGPIWLMKLAATCLDWIPAFPVTRDQLTMLAEGNVTGSASLESLTGRAAIAFIPENLAYLD